MSKILDYLTGVNDPAALAQAVDSLRAGHGAARLQTALTDALTCEVYQTYLVDYAQTKDLALPLSPELQAIDRHLIHCETCRADYHTLQTLSHGAATEAVIDIAVPSPDLTFLRVPVDAGDEVGVWQPVDNVYRHLLTTIQIMFNQSAAWFSIWPSSLTPRVVPVPSLRGEPQRGAVQRLVLPAVGAGLSFDLTIMPGAGLAQLVLGVFQYTTRQPVGRITVTLFNEQQQRLQRADTGADGLVTFADLAAGSYYLQVRTEENQWEMMVVVVSNSVQ